MNRKYMINKLNRNYVQDFVKGPVIEVFQA
jgi:hypothetical protein